MIRINTEIGLLFRKCITSKVSFSDKNTNSRTIKRKFRKARAVNLSSLNGIAPKTENHTRDMKNILQYFEGNKWTEQVNELPQNIIKTTKSKSQHLYLFDDSTADHFTNLIKDDLLTDPQKIIEVNAGTGVLTEKLLNIGIPHLNILESDIKFVQKLGYLQQKYPNNIEIQEADVFCLWKIASIDKHDDGNRVQKLFSNFPQIKWGDESGMKIIGTVVNVDFIKYLIVDIVRQSGIFSYGRPCLYLCMAPSAWLRLTCNKSAGLHEYRGVSVLFQILFDYKLLGKVPRKSFLPWASHFRDGRTSLYQKKLIIDRDELCVVKIEGKKNLFTELISEKYIHLFWYFVNHHMATRTGKVIQQMETWQPDCGPKLIKQDYNIFTQFGDLSPQELLNVFNEFTSWDGFYTAFVPSFESSLQRVEQLLF